MRIETSFLFDLDGTLVDSVYQHVPRGRKRSMPKASNCRWRIHRKIGMSGGLFLNQLLRETSGDLDAERVERLARLHAAAYQRLRAQVRPLPGARELLAALTNAGIRWAIATSGRMETAAINLERRRRSGEERGGDARPRQVREARPRPVPDGRRATERADRTHGRGRRQHLGHARCRPLPLARRRLLSVGTAATNSNARARCACMTIPPICCGISTRLRRGPETPASPTAPAPARRRFRQAVNDHRPRLRGTGRRPPRGSIVVNALVDQIAPRSTPASSASFSVIQSGPSAGTTSSMRSPPTYTCTSSRHAPLSLRRVHTRSRGRDTGPESVRPVDFARWPPVPICDGDAKNTRRMTAARPVGPARTGRARYPPVGTRFARRSRTGPPRARTAFPRSGSLQPDDDPRTDAFPDSAPATRLADRPSRPFAKEPRCDSNDRSALLSRDEPAGCAHAVRRMAHDRSARRRAADVARVPSRRMRMACAGQDRGRVRDDRARIYDIAIANRDPDSGERVRLDADSPELNALRERCDALLQRIDGNRDVDAW